MDVEFGNAGKIDTNDTGWFIGFSGWAKCLPGNLRYVSQDAIAKSLCVKWYCHQKGDPNGEPKPISEGRTISILVSERGQFKLDFAPTPDFSEDTVSSHVLCSHGDYVIWGEGIYHRAFGESPSTILTIRWFES